MKRSFIFSLKIKKLVDQEGKIWKLKKLAEKTFQLQGIKKSKNNPMNIMVALRVKNRGVGWCREVPIHAC